MSRGNHFVCDLWWLMLSLEPLLLACRIINWSRLLLFHEGTFFFSFLTASAIYSSILFFFLFLFFCLFVCLFAWMEESSFLATCDHKTARKKKGFESLCLLDISRTQLLGFLLCPSTFMVDLIRSLCSAMNQWSKANEFRLVGKRKIRRSLTTNYVKSIYDPLFIPLISSFVHQFDLRVILFAGIS